MTYEEIALANHINRNRARISKRQDCADNDRKGGKKIRNKSVLC